MVFPDCLTADSIPPAPALGAVMFGWLMVGTAVLSRHFRKLGGAERRSMRALSSAVKARREQLPASTRG